MSRPAPQSAEDCDAKRQRANAPLDSASSAPPISSIASTGSFATATLQTQPHSPLSAAQRCHTDALHCVFAFLSMKELLPALHSCKQWWAAGCKEPSRSLKLNFRPKFLAALVASPLHRHVADLGIFEPMSLDQLRLLRSLPRLTALSLHLDFDELEASLRSADDGADARQQRAQLLSDALPTTQLRSFGLGVGDGSNASLGIRQALVDALPSAPTLRTVELGISIADVDLSPLLQLPQLSDLYVGDSPSPVQCAVIKQIATLTSLNTCRLNNWNGALLDLLRPPHSLQHLQKMMLEATVVRVPLLAALLTLPALTQLHPEEIEPECWAGLGGFSQLRQLFISWDEPFTAAQRSALESSLHVLPHLSDLTLSLNSDSQSDGLPLTLRLPTLRSLSLYGVRLPSLSFLQHSPLIEYLSFCLCMEMDGGDVMHWLRTVAPPLRRLVLFQSVRLSAAQESLLRPPSAPLPALTYFSYRSPC